VVAERTVKAHVSNAPSKVRLSERTWAATYARVKSGIKG
jgi:DNA-binding NarL/FixJ family response regulator